MKKQKKQERKVKKVNEELHTAQEIMDDILSCGTCADAGSFKLPKQDGIDQIERLIKVLPGINYIENLLVDYLFSNGLTTGNIEQDERLKAFLYRKNKQGNTNISVLRDIAGNSRIYGETGLRWYQGDIYMVDPGTYGALVTREDGIQFPVTFFCADDGRRLNDTKVEFPEDRTVEEFYRTFEEQHLILLDTSEFINVRNTTKRIHGESPLLSDSLRLKLLEATYSRLNYDIEYDGPGRIILRPKDGYVAGDTNEVDSTYVMKQSVKAGKDRLEKAKQEAARVGKEIKNSSSDDVILLSNAFDDHIEHLERVTKATQFFDWLHNEGTIIAQALGMSPSLLELGDVSGNVSMQRIIDNAMENTIVPMREQFAVQISPLLSEKLGIDKVYFGKYQLTSAPDRETIRTKVVEIMTMLNSIGKPETDKLVTDFAEMLSYDIHNSDGSLVELSIGGSYDSDILNKIKLLTKESKSEH